MFLKVRGMIDLLFLGEAPTDIRCCEGGGVKVGLGILGELILISDIGDRK